MKKETVEVFCDLCGVKLDVDNAYRGTGESFRVGIVSITYDIWYGGQFKVSDTCDKCNQSVAEFLFNKKMISNAPKIS